MEPRLYHEQSCEWGSARLPPAVWPESTVSSAPFDGELQLGSPVRTAQGSRGYADEWLESFRPDHGSGRNTAHHNGRQWRDDLRPPELARADVLRNEICRYRDGGGSDLPHRRCQRRPRLSEYAGILPSSRRGKWDRVRQQRNWRDSGTRPV